jgi:MFS family permease
MNAGFALIFARLSDGIGRRNTLILSWLLFGGFSTGSGLSTTLNELIGFRVLQGVGGSGLYTMTFVIGNQITPVKFYGLFGGSIGITTAIGSVLGMFVSSIWLIVVDKYHRSNIGWTYYPNLHVEMDLSIQWSMCNNCTGWLYLYATKIDR